MKSFLPRTFQNIPSSLSPLYLKFGNQKKNSLSSFGYSNMAEAFLQVVLDNLSSLIKDEIGLILGVDEEMQKLSSTLTTLQVVLEDAEDKQIENKPIRDWLQKLSVIVYEIDDILDECNTHVSKLKHTGKLSRYSLEKILYRHKIGRTVRRVTEKLEGVAAERTKFHLREMRVDRPREVAASRETGSMLNHSDQIYGRKNDIKKIVEILVNDVKENHDIVVLPIIGIGGLGKTTLAQLVFNNQQVVDHFDIRIWVCVSDNFELKTLVKAMIEAATGSAKAAALQQLDVVERQLWELLSQKRYLIVLDDVWNDQQEKWFELKDTLSCGSTGASIIVTTRQKKVADIMGTLPAHCLMGLSDEKCWKLLRSRAFALEEEVPPHLEIIGIQIVKKCAGVPLAAKALGGILRFKRTKEEWTYVRESELWKLSPEKSLIMPALRLSYHHLPLELRQCFAYFAAFPKYHEIEKKELILLWIAHGLISSKGNIQGEDIGNQICNELLLRSILQSSFRSNMIIMHDLVHDLAQSVMENKFPGIQSERNIQSASTIREVHFVDRSVLFPKTFQQDMSISSILEFTSLRVLYANDDGIKYLPPSVGNLKHLRYLNMSTSRIRTLPNSLCTLWNLQILNLDHCRNLVALPKKLASLHNLQRLCLSSCKSLSEMPAKMRKLTSLKKLSMFVVGTKIGNQLEELQCFNLSGELEIRHLERVKNHFDAMKANIAAKENLKKLRLSWEINDLSKLEVGVNEKVLEALEPHPNLESLCIQGFSGSYLPCWTKNVTLGKIVEIRIIDCARCRHIPGLGELMHLKKLSLSNVGVEYVIEEVGSENSVKIQFPVLEKLFLSKLPNLKRLSNEQVRNEAFPNLKMLRITQCSSLQLQRLSSLQKLNYLKCGSSTLALLSEQDIPRKLCVEIDESLTCFRIETLVKYSKLRSLTIEGANEISATREGLEALKELITLYLLNCDTMKCIPQGILGHLSSLHSLCIISCRELVELPEDIEHLHNLEVIELSSLPKMVCLSQALQHLSSLKALFLNDLRELEALPDQLPSLRTLKVSHCPKVVSIPALPNVKELSINRCPRLERRCQRGTGEDWHKIAHIRRLHIHYC